MGIATSAPPPARMPPPAAHPQGLGSATVQLDQQAAKKRAQAADGLGLNGTVKSSPTGLVAPNTAKTTLLGG